MARYELTRPGVLPVVAEAASAAAPARRVARSASLTRALLPAIAVVLLAWGLSWRLFGPQELGQDGFLSVDLGTMRLPAMAAFTANDVHPPLYYALLHGWFALVGLNYYGVKVIGIASGALTVALVQRLGWRFGGPAAGLLAGLLLALSPTFLRLSTTARDFVPGLALSVLTLLLLVQLLAPAKSGQRAATAVGLAVATALALLMSYLHWAFWLAEVAACLAGWRLARQSAAIGLPSPAIADPSRQPAKGAPAAALFALLLGTFATAPWYAVFVPRLLTKMHGGMTGYAEAPAPPSLAAVGQAVLTAVTGNGSGGVAVAALAGWCLALALGVVVALQRPGRFNANDGGRRMLFAPLLLAVLGLGALEVAGILWRWQLPKSLATYLVILLPVVALLQAAALGRGNPALRTACACGLVVAVAGQVAWYVPFARMAPIDWPRDAPLNYLATHVQAGDGLLFSNHAQRAQYMLASNWNAIGGDAARTTWPPAANGGCAHGVDCAVVMTSDVTETYLHSTPAEAAQIVAGMVGSSRRIWYAESGEGPGVAPLGRQALASRAYLLWEGHQSDTDLQLYAVGTPDQQWHGTALLGGAVRLAAASYSGQAKPGGPVLVRLVWQDVRPLPASYTVFVHLDAVNGHLGAQNDGLPVTGLRLTTSWQPGEMIDDRHGVALPADLPSGDYRLNVGLYQGQQRLAMADGTNAIQLGVVHVTR